MSGIIRSILFHQCVKRLTAATILHGNTNISRAFSITPYSYQQSVVERQVKKLDMDVRKNGRVSRRDVDGILREIKMTRSATPNQSLLVIRCCGSLISEELPELRTKLVQEVWNVLDKLGVSLDITHYNALLRVYLENEYDFSPTEFLADLEKRGIEPNRVTYQRLISKYCHSGNITGATRILEVMREKETPVNENIFNSLILGHSRANDMKSAEGILDVMKQAGLEPSAETYTLLICGYISQGQLDKVDSILEKCEASEVYFIDKDYLEIVTTLAKYNYDDHIDKILGKIRKTTGYNQDAISYIYKICSMGKPEIGYKLLKTMVRPVRVDGSLLPSGNFFIAHLIKRRMPVEEIIKYCDKLMEDKIHSRPLVVAIECALRRGYTEAVLPLFRVAKEKNIPIKQHYFWPLIVSKGKDNDIDGLMHVLLAMSSDFNSPVSNDTIREYVAPFVLKSDGSYEDALTRLKLSGVSTGAATSGLVTALLEQKNITKAAELCLRHRAYYPPATIRRPLVQSLAETKDIKSFITILKQIVIGLQWAANNRNLDDTKDDDEQIPDYLEFVGLVVCDVVKLLNHYPSRAEFVENLLQAYVDGGFALKDAHAQYMQNMLQSDLTLAISTLIEKLTSTEMHTLSSQTSAPRFRDSMSEIDAESLERLYNTSKESGENKRSIQKQLFNVYARNRDLDKLLELKKELDEDDFVSTEGMNAMLIDTYMNNDKLDEAVNAYETIRANNPDFNLNNSKLLRFALMLVQNDQSDRALKYLEEKENKAGNDDRSFSDAVTAWRILNTFSEKGDVDLVKKFFETLKSKNYIEITNVILGPLIKAHLIKNDIIGALEEFENCALKYRCTPWKSDIAIKLIQSEDANSLQRLTDISTQIHGEINSLYDLMLSFLECGRIRQAKKILETPGLRLRQDRLYNASYKYQSEGSAEHLENLFEITRGINSFDRGDICYNLLIVYDKANNVDKAQSLWLQMQEENIHPTDHFLYTLSELLKRNDKPVPFSAPLREPEGKQISRPGPTKYSPATQELRRLIKENKLDEALNYKSKTNIERFTGVDLSSLAQALLNNNRYEDSKNIVLDILKMGSLPATFVLKQFCFVAMKNGDYETLQEIKKNLPLSLRQIVTIDNRICGAYDEQGKAKEYLQKLESELDNINSPDEYETFIQSYPKGGILGLLMKHPDLVPDVERISEKCLLRNSHHVTPINMMWVYYMLQENFEKADQIWKNYLQTSDKYVTYGSILKNALQTCNIVLLDKLFSLVKEKTDLPLKSLGVIYTTYLDIYLKENNIEVALAKLDEAVNTVTLENIRPRTLNALKVAAGIHSIPFKYDLSRDNEADSSSDEEDFK